MVDNLYSGREYFFLIIDGVGYTVDEPVNWNNILIELLRDAVYYGFTYEFVGGDVDLIFKWNDGGGELLKAQYDLKKGDAKAQLDFGILNSATRERQFLGDLNFNDYHIGDEGITITVSKVAFEALIRTRIETPVSLNALQDLDGNTIPALAAVPLLLHSKEIIKFGKAETAPGITTPYLVDPNMIGLPANQSSAALKWLQPDTTNLTITELETLEGTPLGLSNDDPTTISAYQYKAKEGGFLKVEFIFSAWINIENAGGTPKSVDFHPYIKVKRGSTVIIEEYGFSQNVTNLFGGTIGGTQNFTVSLIPNDEVYIGLRLDAATAFVGFMATNWTNTLTLEQLTEAPASVAYGYKVYELLTRIVYLITGRNDAVYSPFYEPGGPGEKWFITNGYSIRNFSTDDKPVQISFKDAIDGLQMIHNVGTGYGLDADGNDVAFVAPALDFFTGDVITELKNVYDYSERDYKEGTYNELEFAFAKYPDAVKSKNLNGGINTLDEMNTAQTWLTPITTYKAKFTRTSKFIASGYSIEDIRREQFKESPSTSMPEDDSLFIISYTEDIVYSNLSYQFFDTDNSITFNKPVSLRKDDSFILSGTTINGSSFVVLERKDPGGLSFKLLGSVSNEVSIGDLEILPYYNAGVTIAGILYAERNQYFNLDYIISPASVYNVRATPKHALYDWLPVFNSFLWGKPGTAVIKNTTSKNNGDFTSQFLPLVTNPLGAGYDVIKESQDLLMSDISRRGLIHLGIVQELKAQLPYSVITQIFTALRTFTAPRKCFLIVPDRYGKRWMSVINTVKYNPTTETAEFQLFKVQAY